ncbi:kynurenine formamidase-like [Zophobas morio]|uniref:kynurenine formamidase-like n=1 Tax=Zophobas morio TaxID=2755281 RepID=UPI003083D863
MNKLDILYSPSYWAKRLSSPTEVIDHHMKFITNASASVSKKIPCELDIPYGASQRQKIDIFGTDLPPGAPILIFLHGGYWQTAEITRSSYHFIAEPLHPHNIKTLFVGYDLCPHVTLPDIVRQIQVAAKKCLEYAKQTKSKEVYFMGHSAGAHLIASLFTNFVKSISEEEQVIVKGVILMSGVFDLSLLQKTVINESLKLDEEVAAEMSPMKQSVVDGAGTAFYLIVGRNESPEFIKQSREFGRKLESSGFKAEVDVIESVDHFDIVERLVEGEFEVTRRVVGIIAKH